MPWTRYEIATGEFTTAKGRRGLHGDLRDFLLEPDGSRAWALLTHGLALLDLDDMHEIELLRENLPTYQWRLHRLGDSLLAAVEGRANGVTVIDLAPLAVVRTLRVPPPDVVIRDKPGSVEFVSFSAGEARHVDLSTLRSKRTQPVITGMGAHSTGDAAWLFQGFRQLDERMLKVRFIKPRRLTLFDLRALEVVRRGGAFVDGKEVLGFDADGHLVVTTWNGVSIVDPLTFERLGGMQMLGPGGDSSDFWTAALLPDGRSAACIPNQFGDPERLIILSW